MLVFMKKQKARETNGKQGLAFGVMEGTILQLGLMLGLSVTNNREVTVIALLVTALADALANAAGLHVSQEAEGHHDKKEVLKSTVYCFASTFLVMAFLATPIFLFDNYSNAIIVSSTLAIIILGTLGFFVARKRNETVWKISLEYILMGAGVAIVSYLLGESVKYLIA